MATVKPQGWVHAVLGVDSARPSIAPLNSLYQKYYGVLLTEPG